MDRSKLLFEDYQFEKENPFIKNGWVTLFESSGSENGEEDLGVYSYLVSLDQYQIEKTNSHWSINLSSYFRASFQSKSDGSHEYLPFSVKGCEPFLHMRCFSYDNQRIKYFDVSEEFILYFDLLEIGKKEDRKYLFIDEVGDAEEVLLMNNKRVIVRLKFLKEYLALRKMVLCNCFDFHRFVPVKSELAKELSNKEEEISNEKYCLHHLVRDLDHRYQSWIIGKYFIQPATKFVFHRDRDDDLYESFIIGTDEEGKDILMDCSNHIDKSFVATYFDRKVLDKYLSNPDKYQVEAMRLSCPHFSLKMDNNSLNHVLVFLIDLRMLPIKEQKHWKQFNIAHKGFDISRTYYQTMVQGEWIDRPEELASLFRQEYELLNKQWEAKFGWRIHRKLNNSDQKHLSGLHVPASNNEKQLHDQIQSLCKILIDRLNEPEIRKLITEPARESLNNFESFLSEGSEDLREDIDFLRKLYRWRSIQIAHSGSTSDNREIRKVHSYFDYNGNNAPETVRLILNKLIHHLRRLKDFVDNS